MRRARPLAGIAVAIAGAGALATGCILFQGGTDGYSSAGAEAGVGGSCKSAADCNGSNATLCCYDLDGGTASSTCQQSCVAYAQACKVASDCGDGGACVTNSCTVEASIGVSASASVTTCGPIPICTQ